MVKRKDVLFIACFTVLVVMGVTISAFAQETAVPKTDLETALKDFSQLNDGNKNMVLTGMGLPQASDFDVAKIVACLIFGGIGFVAFVYGKKNSLWRPMVIGIVLMVYPYFLSGRLAVFLVGSVLTLALYFLRE